ncbi:MAG: protein translocase subunit SecF [Clostridiales bacterium]|nr:protein translocase subunit SecF [Clostridiales bacterium]
MAKKFKVEDLIKFPIAKNIKYWIIAPLAIIILAGIMFGVYAGVYKDAGKGMNIGIDFAGGSLATVALGDSVLTDATYSEYESLIRDAIESNENAEKVAAYAVSDEYAALYGKKLEGITATIAKAHITYSQTSGSGEEYAIVFKYDNVSKSYDSDNTLSTYRNEVIKQSIANALKEKFPDTDIDELQSMITYENIGATASAELIKTALICLAVSLALILVYIIIRFEIWSGLAAVIALIHDVAILIAMTIICHIQVNSAFVAAIITIVSYSINNTIVIFDRVRENLRNERKLNAKFDTAVILDNSVKHTLLRSINSTVTTMIPIVIFAIFGSSTVNEFALPVIFGLIAGFYSSMFISPSLYYVMSQAWEKHKANKTKIKTEAAAKPKYVGAKQ